MKFKFVLFFCMIVVGGCDNARLSETSLEDAKATIATVEDFHFIAGGFDRGRGPDGNTEIYKAPDGLVVIDTGRHPAHSQNILNYAAEQQLPITAIINTHWHLDHTTGNMDLKAAFPDATVYATPAINVAMQGILKDYADSIDKELAENAELTESDRVQMQRALKSIREPAALLPDVPVTAPMTVPINGRNLELNVTDHAVSESDIWIWDPAFKTVIAGDLVTFPAPLFDTGCAAGWLAAFDAIEQKPYERIVPGHGDPMSPEAFHKYRSAFDNLLACAAEKTGAECAPGWVEDAGALMPETDREKAPRYIEYYVDNVLRSPEHQAEFCQAG